MDSYTLASSSVERRLEPERIGKLHPNMRYPPNFLVMVRLRLIGIRCLGDGYSSGSMDGAIGNEKENSARKQESKYDNVQS